MEDYERHPEKNVFCECCSETLDVPNPPNYLWVQQQQVCAPAAQVMMVPQQAPAYVPQTNQGAVEKVHLLGVTGGNVHRPLEYGS